MFVSGQKVVCINDEFPDWAKAMYNDLPVKDSVYTVRDVFPAVAPIGVTRNEDGSNVFIGKHEIAITLEEINNDINPKSGQEHGYIGERFAPLNDPLEEKEKEKISQPKPKKKELQKV